MTITRTLAMLGFSFSLFSGSSASTVSCFDSATFDTVLRYSTWKMQTNKTIRVMVNDFEMAVLEKRSIEFRQDGYTVARVTQEVGISVLATQPSGSLESKINEAYCELARRAKRWRQHYM